MDMQLQQLRYFLAVADSRHFTQAAEAVGVTQPTLSKQIHTLEEDLGAALFHRNRGAITLTEAGEALLPLAQRIVADAETARHEIGDLIGLRTGRLRLGATPSLCTSLAAETLKLFRDRHPDIRLQVEEGGSQDLVRALTGGDLDLALIILPESGTDPTLHTEPLLTESLVVASASPLHHRELEITDLRHQDLVMFRPGYDLRDATLEACAKAGFTPTFAVEGGEMDAVLGFVEVGLGVALVPRMVLAGRPRLHATPLAAPGVPRTVALARRRDVEPSHAAKAFQDILVGYLEGRPR
ncbi:LysR family transcriptional regulator [Longispora urticae]